MDRGGDGDDETRSRSGDKRPKRKRFIRRLHIRVQAAVRFIQQCNLVGVYEVLYIVVVLV